MGSYLYNGFEQRVQKTAGGATTDLVYDRFGHLLGEVNGSTGAAIREYIWMDDLPVAMVDDTGASPVLYYIHTDQLGAPQKITDASLNIDWDGVFDPFGNVSSLTGTLTSNLRFPGQYLDAETALNQNWFRDYDSTTGRYIQSDPMGLAGGINTYIYALNNPVLFIDTNGWDSTVTINQYNDLPFLGGFSNLGHIGLCVGDAPCRGFYPIDPESTAGAQGVWQEVMGGVPGSFQSDISHGMGPSQVAESVTLPITDEQAQDITNYMNNANGATYDALVQNCAEEAANALNAAGIPAPYEMLPADLINDMSIYQDTGGTTNSEQDIPVMITP